MKNPLPTDWTYPEFHAFAMLYAANADSHITAEEIALIRPTVSAEQFSAIETAFKNCCDAAALDHILSYQDRYFPTQTAKDQLIADMQHIFDADEKFTLMERSFRQIFQRII